MHTPIYFAETRIEKLHDLIRAYPLATLAPLNLNGIDADHIPFEIDPTPAPLGTLRGHIARANPLWRAYSRTTEALAIFRGVDAYISPSWYPSKQTTGEVVPTWNYAVAHARGPLRIIEDRDWLRSFVAALTHRFEAGRPQA